MLARGCAYVVMENRQDAVSVIDRLIIKGQKCKVRGRGSLRGRVLIIVFWLDCLGTWAWSKGQSI